MTPQRQPDNRQPGINVDFFCVTKVAFEHAAGAIDLPHTTAVEGNFEIGANVLFRDDGLAARLVMFAKLDSLYKVEVHVMAQFSESSESTMRVKAFASSAAAVAAVIPYLRQAVGDATQRGRFGPVWLNPINPQSLIRKEAGGVGGSVAASAQGTE